jgi:hypothetical protein
VNRGERCLERVEEGIVQMLDALIVGQRFLASYRDASTADEEGLLISVDPAAMRELWVKVDEAAEAFSVALRALEPKDAPAAKGLLPLDMAGVLWVAAIDRVPIEDRVEWVRTMEARVAEINAARAVYDGDPPGAGWQE